MYTILVTDSNELVTTVTERIMRRSKLVDNLHFLVNQTYKDLDMSGFTVCLEYVLPVSRNYCSEILELSDELYKEKLEYTLPFDTNLTSEAGDIEIQLTFTQVTNNDDGTQTQYVRKTSTTTITIYPISAWSDIIPDESLTALDQRLIKADAMMSALEAMEIELATTKADNIVVEDNKLSLTASGTKIGDEVDIVTPAINDGDVDGTYDGIVELDDADIDVSDSDDDEDEETGFIEL